MSSEQRLQQGSRGIISAIYAASLSVSMTLSDIMVSSVKATIRVFFYYSNRSSLAVGVLSDRYDRKLMVYISGRLQALVVLIFLLSASFATTVIMGLIFGLGYSAYQAVDWALASDVLPTESNYAKDMASWHVSFTLPQVLAVPIGGVLLDTFQRIGRQNEQPNLGYTVLFMLVFIYFVLGTLFVRQIKGPDNCTLQIA